MGLQPQRAGGNGRIDASFFPPCGFIATEMSLAVVTPAQWHGEFVADLARQRTVLREAQMMGIRGPAAANQTGLFGHEPDVVPVTNPARFGMGQQALVDAVAD